MMQQAFQSEKRVRLDQELIGLLGRFADAFGLTKQAIVNRAVSAFGRRANAVVWMDYGQSTTETRASESESYRFTVHGSSGELLCSQGVDLRAVLRWYLTDFQKLDVMKLKERQREQLQRDLSFYEEMIKRKRGELAHLEGQVKRIEGLLAGSASLCGASLAENGAETSPARTEVEL